jgi:hypothetical protein
LVTPEPPNVPVKESLPEKVFVPESVLLPFRNPRVAPDVPVFWVAAVPNDVPFVLVTVRAPVFASVASPDTATAVATLEPLPTRISVLAKVLFSNVPDVGNVTDVLAVVVIPRV